MTIPEGFNISLQHHQHGRLAEAEAIYRQVLAADPRHADAMHLLGVIAHQGGQNELAVDLITKAIALLPSAATFHSNLGMALSALGRPDEAIAAYRRAIQLKPDYVEAHSNLGFALANRGLHGEATAACRRAIELMPECADAHYNLGIALGNQGLLDEAIAAYRRTLHLRPDYANACNNLGTALTERREPEEAIAAYRMAIQCKPDHAEAHNNLGSVLTSQGRLDEAAASYRQAIQIRPDFADFHCNLGNVLRDRGHLDDAIAEFRRAIELRPEYPEAHNSLGTALMGRSQTAEAIATFRRAIKLKPGCAEIHNNLGNALSVLGDFDGAIAEYRQALRWKPDYAEAHNNLGNALRERGDLDEAMAAYRRAIQLRPDFAEAHNNLGTALRDAGLVAEMLAEYRLALKYAPHLAAVHCNLLLGLHYPADADPAAIFAEHRRWNEAHARPLAQFIVPHMNAPDPERRLRIGYVSPDFREHSVALFMEDLLAGHDASRFEILYYAEVSATDPGALGRLRERAGWRETTGMSDAGVAALIRRDEIDILVDLAGHTKRSRLPVFAHKPAPVQATYLGYCDTTGMDAMDWRLTDAHADPPGTTEHLHSEKLIRVPQCAWCFRPPADAPAIVATARAESGGVTFGCFNMLQKITGEMLAVWARILTAVPGSRLLVKSYGFRAAGARRRVLERLESAGISSARLDLVDSVPTRAEHLALYGRVDIALDTFPYHGTTTTCEALWMGVPVVSLAGKTHASRVGVSLLSNAGLPDLIARDEDDYVRIATALASDATRLSELRGTMREKMKASPLMDAPHFAQKIEQAYRTMWRAWCAGQRTYPTP